MIMEVGREKGGGKVLSLIEKATNSTAAEVDPRLLKAIKSVVRYSDMELRLAANTLLDLMKRDHSQVRYLTLLIIDELFMRSKLFRSILVDNLDQLLSLSVGFRRTLPLPAPPAVASILRSKAIEFLEKWNSSFGIHYRQLRLGFDYLKNTLKLQFPNLQANAARIQQERAERERRSREILLKKFEMFKDNFSSIKEEIMSIINEIGECLDIVRTNEEFMPLPPADDEYFEEFRSSELLQIRLNTLKEGEKVHENTDNKVVFDALRELYKLLETKHFVSVQEWISVLLRVEVADNRFRDSALKELIDIQNRLKSVKKKCEESGCALPNTANRDEEEDDFWEEGKIGSLENERSTAPNNHDEYFSMKLTSNKFKNKTPESSKKDCNDNEILNPKGGETNLDPLRSKLLAEAPVMKWGSFLDNWGSHRKVLANQRGLELESHWGRVDYDAVIPAEKPKPKIPYAHYCNDVVPKPPLSSHSPNFSTSHSDFLPFRFGYLSGGGDRIFNRTGSDTPKSLSFSSLYSQKTASDGVLKVRASLYIRNPVVYSVSGRPKYRSLLRIRYRGPRVFGRFDDVVFSLNGYWSESTGKLCMVGSGSRYVDLKHFDVVLKLNYPKNSSIYGSLIVGTLECLNVKEDDSKSDYFEPIKILGLSQNPNYEYSLVEKLNGSDCSSGNGGRDSNTNNTNANINLSLSKLDGGVCFMLNGRTSVYELEYGSDCGNVNCNPFGGSIGYLPDRIVYQGLRCEQRRKMQMLLGFPNSSYSGSGTQFPFDPNATLIAEGAWDDIENRFCGVACRILNVSESWSNAFVGDCSIGFTLRFPAVMSLRNQSSVVGEIWSKKDVNDSGYFGKIGFQSYWERSIDPQGLKYEYTVIESVRKSCAQGKTVRGKGKSYPDGYSPDMRFDMMVRNNDGKVAQGYSSPLFVGDSLYARQYYGRPLVLAVPRMTEPAAVQLTSNHSRMLNISYKMSFRPPPDFRFGGDASSKVLISAEGIYDRDTGFLCMIGCWHLQPNNQNLIKNGSLDCEIRITVQFPPFNAEHDEIVKGTIESTRAKSDPLYFESLQLSSNSITTTQAKESIWRMDLEITMVLISNTLACVFVGLQLFYVKKQPHVLPFISIVMLIVLTLGHMIPLLLNFEALFVANHNPTNFFLRSGGWLEVNEVIVRVITMVAFLLQLRLLQLTWSARKGDGSQKGWWDSDRKVLYVTLPMYIAGGFIAWFVHQWKNSYQRPLGSFRESQLKGYHLHALQLLSYQQHSFWEDLKSYAGLLLNGFLLPQILFNLFFNSGEKALASSFYVGTTIVRLMPHAYDLYRAHSSTWYLHLSYIYANHRMDFYSTAWDIIIPCGGLLFAGLVFLQQQFGGRCILPKRFRESSVYKKVPVISNDEL